MSDYKRMTSRARYMSGFTWGRYVYTHEIGNIKIVEYIADNKDFSDYGETRFHPFIDDEDTSQSYTELRRAIVGAISYEAEGPNSQAAEYFFRMIGLEDD